MMLERFRMLIVEAVAATGKVASDHTDQNADTYKPQKDYGTEPPKGKNKDSNKDGDGSAQPKCEAMQQNSASHEDLDRVGYPKDSDKRRLSNLVEGIKTTNRKSNEQYEVKRISCRRKHDSDSESDSGSSTEEETPMDVSDSKSRSPERTFTASPANLAQTLSETESVSELCPKQKILPEKSTSEQVPNDTMTLPKEKELQNAGSRPISGEIMQRSSENRPVSGEFTQRNSGNRPPSGEFMQRKNERRPVSSEFVHGNNENRPVSGEFMRRNSGSRPASGEFMQRNSGSRPVSGEFTKNISPESQVAASESLLAANRGGSGIKSHLPVRQQKLPSVSPVSPNQHLSQSSDQKGSIVRRTSSGKSDSSMSSAHTASPATKMRLLDMASKRALERESFDHEESGQEEMDQLSKKLHPEKGPSSRGSSPRRHVNPEVKVTSDIKSETESHGGDSGHISGTSADNTPEHKSPHSHLSIPSIANTSTSVEEQQHDEEEDDIDGLVATHKNLNHYRGNLRNSFTQSSTISADSRESLYSVYSDAGEINYGRIPVSGEILFGLDYNYKTGALEIHVKQCKDIAPVDTKRNISHPYVKTYLLPDKTRSGKRKTKIKKHTLNPTFDEVLRYVISKSEAENRVLWVTVWHQERFGHNDFLGEVMIGLDCYKFGDASPVWYPLQERLEAPGAAPVAYKGDLLLSLKYVPPEMMEVKETKKGKSKKTKEPLGELQVLIKEARNLTAVRANGSSDPFVKGYLLPDKHRGAKQKTAVVKRNCNPTWNDVFLFENLTAEDLKDRSLELTIWDFDKITSNQFLGGVRLNLGIGISGGRKADWMDARGEEIAVWQCMLDRPNCWNDGTIGLRATMGKSEIRK